MFEEKTTQTHICKTTGLSSSTWYDHKKQNKNETSKVDLRKNNKGRPLTKTSKTLSGEEICDSKVVEALKNLRSEKFLINGGGYRKLTYYLRMDYNYRVNKKKVYRLCKENKLLLPKKIKKKRNVAPISKNRIITKPFKLWELDIKYGYLEEEKKFFFLMAIIDVYLRYIVGYHVGKRCLGEDLKRTLILSLDHYGDMVDSEELVVRMDNGPQMTSHTLSDFIKYTEGVSQELIPVRTPNKNAHIESFYSIVERECFQPYTFQNFSQAYETMDEFIEFYQSRRIHSALRYRTPQQCYELYKQGQLHGIKNVHL